MAEIILASGSPRRRELLAQIGLEFRVVPARGEEVITRDVPSEIVCELSAQKAWEVAERVLQEDAGVREPKGTLLIIGADTVVSQDGVIMGKPADAKEAVRMLERLQGKKHSVFTGVTVIVAEAGEKPWVHTFFSETKVEVYPMGEEDIAEYVETGEPLDKAGAYGIQGRFAAWVKGIEGDYNNVVGLPVSALWQIIKNYR